MVGYSSPSLLVLCCAGSQLVMRFCKDWFGLVGDGGVGGGGAADMPHDP